MDNIVLFRYGHNLALVSLIVSHFGLQDSFNSLEISLPVAQTWVCNAVMETRK